MSEHRIQVRMEDDQWARAQRAASENGLLSVSKLCELLLHREYVRLRIDQTDEGVAVAESGEAEHRIQVRVKEAKWTLAQEMASAKGLSTVSDLCRQLLDEEFARFRQATKRQRPRKKPGGRR